MFQGFRKSDLDCWEFSNEEFIKGEKNLLKNIVRRKQTQTQGQGPRKSSQQKEIYPSTPEEDKRSSLSKEVECLKTDKNKLMQELVMLKKHQLTSQHKLLVLREQLKGMEKNQQQMLSFIVMAMQNPGFFVQLVQPKENSWRAAETGKNVISEVDDDCEPEPPVSSDKMIVRYQFPMDETSEPPCFSPAADSELSMDLEFSEEMRDFIKNIDLMPGPLDEKLLSSENYAPLVLPDIPDGDFILDQLLLSSPITEEEMEPQELDSETSIYPEFEGEKSFQDHDSGEYQNLNDSANMDFLTEEMDSRLKC